MADRGHPTLAKLTRPRVHEALARERLFARLDEDRARRPALCVVGPPGAGKTTLLASWLDARTLGGIWYQVDPGDGDLATFFYYLRMAAAALGAGAELGLPLLTPEYLLDVEGYSRRFFRALFALLPRGDALVLDNYQEVPADARFHTLISEAVNEIPPGLTMVVISRRDPPDCYARLIANEHVSFIQWEDLRLSRDEAQAISAKRAAVTPEQFDLLYRAADGWAAGLTLMLERLKRNGMVPEVITAETREAVFEYFAGVIFDRLPADTQHVCLTTALLPHVTARGAELVSGQPQAAQLLEHLYRGRLFTDRRMVVAGAHTSTGAGDGLVATYQYHPLFRAFLLARGRKTWPRDVRQRWALTAASLMEVSGQMADAIALLVELGEWSRAAALIVQQAPRLIAQGRWQTLHTWLRAFPDQVLEDAPWLLYWWGVSFLPIDQDRARDTLERAYSLMHVIGDVTGQLLAAAGVIDSIYYRWASFMEMDRWIVAIQGLLGLQPAFASVDAELHVNSSLLIALAYRQPGHPMLGRCVARVTVLLDSEADLNLRITAGTFLLGYCYFAADYALGARVIERIEPLLADAGVTPLNRLWWRTRIGYYAYHIADYPGALQALDEADAIVQGQGLAGLHTAEPVLAYFRVLVSLGSRQTGTAHQGLAVLRRLARAQRPFNVWYLQSAESIVALLEGRLDNSLELARASIHTAADIGMLYIQALSLTATAHVLARMGRFDEGLSAAQEAKAFVEDSVIGNMGAELLFVEAWIAAQRDDLARSRALVQSAFEASRRTGYAFWFRSLPEVLPHACELALSAGIDPPYVQAVIARYAIQPRNPYAMPWLWPLRIVALGRFAVMREGDQEEPRAGTRKPMELLKAIVTLGVEDVAADLLIDRLWPGAEGDAAHRALDTTLHRLRKQLGDDRAVVLKAGKVGLNPKSCWVDVSAFEHLVRESMSCNDRRDALRAGAALQALYCGPLLASEVTQPWMLGPRQRLHARFLSAVAVLGDTLEGLGELDAAAALYRHAIEVDALAEPVYRRLMGCYAKTGQGAAATEVYRMCCAALSAAGVARPTAETDRLYQTFVSRQTS
jgi:ATP/maltotriose-dependent transcriptional regulator MalT/DNA-binding SARP family transcriptional activator